ncbi:MAG: hypothetical protein KIT57_12560 [Blastocatellales bacterium]|nr:hypothetical protein [Blastocatellales bacterium]
MLLVMQQNPAPQQINLSWVFVNDNLTWESPPKELKKTYLEASASLVIFYPAGDFAFVTCYLFRDRRSGRLSMCRGCGFSISKGTWTRDHNNTVTVKFRTIYTPALVEGMPMPGPEVERYWIFRGQSKGRVAAIIQSPEGKFIPLSNLTNLDDLSHIIAFYSRQQQ